MANGQVSAVFTSNGVSRNLAVYGDSTVAWVETRDIDFDEPKLDKYADTYTADIVGTQLTSMTMQIGVRDRLNDAIEWGAALSLANGDEPVNERHTARFWRFKFYDAAVTEIWKLSAWEVYGKIMARKKV